MEGLAAYAGPVRTTSVSVEPSSTCRAPHVALRFSPDGHVHACCVNDLYPLGHVDRQSIREIWNGRPVDELRDALDGGDYGHGCQDCETDHRAGRRTQTHAEQFDRFPQPAAPLAWPQRVEFALSNTCNLQCVQCNGDLSSAIRSQREHRPALRSPYGDAFFDELRDLLPHVEAAVFIGGEPFLALECRRVWDLLLELGVQPEVHVTTNGTVWDDRVEHYLHALQMNVAVSIDGASAAVNDAIRSGTDFVELIANRDRFLAATRSYGGSFTLNHCLMRGNWHELGDFLVEADRLDVAAHVIPVHYPSFLSLFSLSADALRTVVADLEASDAGQHLVRNRRAWDESLRDLHGRLASLEGGAPVAVRTGPTDRPDRRLVDAVSAELAVWSGQPALTIRSPYGIVDELEIPPWAASLGLDDFAGGPIEALEQAMTARLGPRAELRTEPGGEGFTWISYTHRLPTGVARFRTAILPYWGVVTGTTAAVVAAAPTGIEVDR